MGVDQRVQTSISAAGVLRLRTRASSQPVASAFADQVVQRAILLRNAAGGGIVVGDFEDGLGDWSPPRSRFSLSPVMQRLDDRAQLGRHALAVDCGNRLDCGASTIVAHEFRARVAYPVSALVRRRAPGDGPAAVRLVAGTGAADVVTSALTPVGQTWKRISLTWTPKRDLPATEVGVQVTRRSSAFLIDGVAMVDPIAAGVLRRQPELTTALIRKFAQACS